MMTRTEIIARFNMGEASEEDVRQIERWIESSQVQLHELDGYAELLAWYNSVHNPEPAQRMSDAFYQQLAEAKKRSSAPSWFAWLDSHWNSSPSFKWAYSFLLVAVGLGIGWFGGRDTAPVNTSDEIASLSKEVYQMKEMMMLSMLEKESTSERLKAVNLTSDLPEATVKVTDALFKTLNNDENVNVRLATLEALYAYADNPGVREGLIQSISIQDSPLVQVALAEMMVALQEKNSIQQLKQLLDQDNTPDDVKQEIENSINLLI